MATQITTEVLVTRVVVTAILAFVGVCMLFAATRARYKVIGCIAIIIGLGLMTASVHEYRSLRPQPIQSGSTTPPSAQPHGLHAVGAFYTQYGPTIKAPRGAFMH